MSTVFRVVTYLKRYPVLAISQLTCAVLMTVLVIVFPEVTKTITGEVIPQRDFDQLLPLALIVAGTFLATNLFNALRIILNNTFEQALNECLDEMNLVLDDCDDAVVEVQVDVKDSCLSDITGE